MSKENTATERLSITANVVLLGSYLFMGVCLLAGAILVLTQPLPFAENPMVMKVGMGWVMIPVSLFIICSNIIKIVRRRNASSSTRAASPTTPTPWVPASPPGSRSPRCSCSD